MTNVKSLNYSSLESEFQKITHLGNILSLAYWDSATNLPNGSAKNRQQEIAATEAIIHEMITSYKVGDLIRKARDEEDYLNEWQKANLNKIQKIYDHAICIDSATRKEHALITGECEHVWREARMKNDWDLLLPYLDKVFAGVKKIALMKAEKFGIDAYDILLDTFDPDSKSENVARVYDFLKRKLPDLIQRIIKKQQTEKVLPLKDKIEEGTQRAIGLKIIKEMGFNMNLGRLDKSTHPFCSGTNDDVRITTRYEENNFLSGLMGIIHEAGHGLYQLNLPDKYRNQPVGQANGMAFHESQSLIMEMQASRSREFMTFLAKILRDDFQLKGEEYTAENLYRLVTRVTPSFIRVDADEVTYPLHVILRFEIERAILNNEISTKEIPEYWGQKMELYLGIKPDNDKVGCMQDIHWPSGMIGYFPTYTNGAIIAAMLMKAAERQYGNICSGLVSGSFADLNNYLNRNLRSYGSLKRPAELLREATGYDHIVPELFIDYLESKYLA